MRRQLTVLVFVGLCVLFVAFSKLGEQTRAPIVRCSVCLPLSITSRYTTWKTLSESAFAQHLIPSLLAWIEPECEYGLYLGYDEKDRLLDTPGLAQELHQLNLPVNVKIKAFRYNDTAHRNCHAINYVTEECYNDGYQYFLRVNDDSVFVSSWTLPLIRLLQENDDFGAVGLIDRNMKRIFTHSFISRKHFQIFQFHFPWEFFNWWSDDWITYVYGEEHTYRSQIEIVHKKMSRRYAVVTGGGEQLEKVLQETRLQWRAWAQSSSNYRAGKQDLPKRSVLECASDEGRGTRQDALIACLRRMHNCSVRDAKRDLGECGTYGKLGYKELWRMDAESLSKQVKETADSSVK